MADQDTTDPNFDSLPVEVLGKIFSNLAEWERQKLRIISWKCNAAVKAFCGIRLDLTNETGQKYISLYEQNIKNARLNCFSVSLDASEAKTILFLTGLQTLELYKVIVPYNLTVILSGCPNLETLKFSHNKIMKPDRAGFMNVFTSEKLNLPSLKTLKIEHWKHRDEYGRRSIPEYTVTLFRFLMSMFSGQKLVNIEVSYPSILTMIDCLFDPRGIPGKLPEHDRMVYELICSNRNTLQTITFGGLESYYQEPRKQRTVKLHQAIIQQQSSLQNTAKWLPQLMEVVILEEHYSSVMNSIIQKALPYQTCLKYIAFVVYYQDKWDDLLSRIEALHSTLQVVRAQFRDRNHTNTESISCEPFKNCLHLTELSILLSDGSTRSAETMRFNDLTNLNLLPSTLRVLRIAAVLVFPNQGIQGVSFQNLPNLRKLELFSKPWFKLRDTIVYEMQIEYIDHMVNSLTSLRILRLGRQTYNVGKIFDNERVDMAVRNTIPEELIAELEKRKDFRTTLSGEVVTLTTLRKV